MLAINGRKCFRFFFLQNVHPLKGNRKETGYKFFCYQNGLFFNKKPNEVLPTNKKLAPTLKEFKAVKKEQERKH